MLAFTKVVASGNDFVVVDNRAQAVIRQGIDLAKLAQEVCARKLSIGADGLLVIEESDKGDFKMRIFNPDGSEVDMCGNGIRAISFLAREDGIAQDKMKVETKAGVLESVVGKDQVKVLMSVPKDIKLDYSLSVDGEKYQASSLNTGVPHVVIEVKDLENFDVISQGAKIRYHGQFAPEGTNANFIQLIDKNKIRVRTYERGVENETLACGTGSTASAIVVGAKRQGDNKFCVLTQSGEELTIYFKNTAGEITDVYLEGGAKIVYRGRIY